VRNAGNKKPLSDLPTESVQPKGAVLQRTIGPLGLEIKPGMACLGLLWTARHAACRLRGKRRAGLRCARIDVRHPWRTPTGRIPCVQICSRQICRGRQTASASSGRLATWLRSSAVPSVPARTSPLRSSPQTAGAKGLRLRSGLCRAGIHHRRMLRNRLGVPCWPGCPSLPLARGHWLARRLPSLPRPRTALHFPAHYCQWLR